MEGAYNGEKRFGRKIQKYQQIIGILLKVNITVPEGGSKVLVPKKIEH